MRVMVLQWYMPRLRILHLSDLHERVALPEHSEDRKTKVKVGAAQRYRVLGNDSGFWTTLTEIQKTAPVDMVCFTGDIADWGLPEEFRQATPRIKRILETLKLPDNKFFAIPGNHDINRNLNPEAWKAIRKHLADLCSIKDSLILQLEEIVKTKFEHEELADYLNTRSDRT